jgi:hypothetical protein
LKVVLGRSITTPGAESVRRRNIWNLTIAAFSGRRGIGRASTFTSTNITTGAEAPNTKERINVHAYRRR